MVYQRVRKDGAQTIWIFFVDLKPTTPSGCRLRTNVLHGDERFDKRFEENKISQEPLQYLKQQTLIVPASIPEMKHIQNCMGHLLYRTNLGDDEKAKQYVQLQNKFLTYKYQLKSLIREAPMPTKPQQPNQISTTVLTGDVAIVPKPVQAPPEIITATPVQAPTQVTAPALSPPPPPFISRVFKLSAANFYCHLNGRAVPWVFP